MTFLIQDGEEILTQSDILFIAKKIRNKKFRALFILEYLTGGRVSEIINQTTKRQFELKKINQTDFLQINNLKTQKNKQIKKRNLPIPIHKEGELVKLFLEHIENKPLNEPLFRMNRQRAWKIIKDILSEYKPRAKNKMMNSNHYLRHCRLTHLVTIYDYNEHELVKFAGWTDARPAKHYISLKVSDLAKKMI